MCVQIRIFMPKSEIRVKFGIYNFDMCRFATFTTELRGYTTQWNYINESDFLRNKEEYVAEI